MKTFSLEEVERNVFLVMSSEVSVMVSRGMSWR